MMINAFCSDLGWLFNDLLLLFEQEGCVSTFEPAPDADAWIVLRSSEARLCPELSRAVVQIHCMEPQWMGKPEVLSKAGAFCFTHPYQPEILRELGVDMKPERPDMMRPVGSLSLFTVRESMPDVFTVGWVGRNTGRKGLDLFVEAITEVTAHVKVRVIFAGANLRGATETLEDRGVVVEYHERESHQPFDALGYRALYHSMDVLCITSETEAGPLPLFEALACGVPVVSTDVGWASHLNTPSISIGESVEELRQGISTFAALRPLCFDHSPTTARAQPWRLEHWIRENIELAERVAR